MKLRLRHLTRYTYDKPVEGSAHRVHLRPVDDRFQSLTRWALTVTATSPEGLRVLPQHAITEYEDPFGNLAARFRVPGPYTALDLLSEADVELTEADPFDFTKLIPDTDGDGRPDRPRFPLTFLPAERQLLAPYLLPPELPDAHLRTLADHARTLVEANHHDLMETLFALNLSIFREFKYAPGTTTLATTPFDTLCSKSGVCQDFTNLFVCLARLLGIPARYRCGYLRTGNAGESRQGSDATHAWVEAYIPDYGWKGFDPTNGVLAHKDHIRLSHGRAYPDTAPISGTLFSQAKEALHVDVEVLPIDPA